MVSGPFDGLDRRSEMQPVPPSRRQGLNVARRSAPDRPPVRSPAKAQHSVVVEELSQEASREAPHLSGIGGPHGGVGNDQALDEWPREAAGLKPVTERGTLAGLVEQLSRGTV